MEIKRRMSLLRRVEQLHDCWTNQTLWTGQHYLSFEQLTKLENINQCIRIGRAYPCCHSSWSIHSMVRPTNLKLIESLILKLTGANGSDRS